MGKLLLMIILIALIVVPVVIIDQVNKYTAANQVRITESQAQIQAAKERQSYYDSVTAQAEVDLQRAIGERAVLEAAADAVKINNKIVYYVAVEDKEQADSQYSIALLVIGMLIAAVIPTVSHKLLDSIGARLRESKREKDVARDIRRTTVADRLPESEF